MCKESKKGVAYWNSKTKGGFIIQIKTKNSKEIECVYSEQLEEVRAEMHKEWKKPKVRMSIRNSDEETLSKSILYAARKLNVPVVQKAFWPNNKTFAVCLTHDVDEIRKTYQYVTHSLRGLRDRNFGVLKNQCLSFLEKLRGKEPYWTFEELIDLERKLGVRSTFFFLNETGRVKLFNRSTWRHYGRRYDITNEKVAEMIRTLHSEGWEIGLHGSFYSYNSVDKLKKEKKILEEVLGSKVHGIRQHNLNLDIPHTWRIQEETGLDYDTTLGFNDRVGFRWGTCFPFHPVDNETGRPLKLLEIPLAIEDIALLRYYEDPWAVCMELINTVERQSGVLTLLWHHSVFNELEYPGWAEMYERIIKLCEEKNAWITTAGEIAKWWKKREESHLECEYDNGSLKIIPYPKSQKHFIDIHLPEGKRAEIFSTNAKLIRGDEKSITIYASNLEKNGEIVLEIM